MEGPSYRVDPRPSSSSSSFPPPPTTTSQPACPGAPAWGELPSDALAVIINDCGLAQSDVAAVRLTCRHWRHTGATWLRSLSPACASLEQVADIARRFPFLTSVDLTRCDTRLVGHACLCRDASSRLAGLLAALAAMPSLTALTLSDTFSERMGQKMWAAGVCAQALLDQGDVPSGAAEGDRAEQAAVAPDAVGAAHHPHQLPNQHAHPPPPQHDGRSSATPAAASVASTSTAASTLPPSTPTRGAQAPAAGEGPARASTPQAASTAPAAASGDTSSTQASEPADSAAPGPSCAAPHADLLGYGALSEPLARQSRQQQQQQQGLALGQEQEQAQPQDVDVEPEQEHAERQLHNHGQAAAADCSTPESAAAAGADAAAAAPAPGTPGPATPQQVPAASPPPVAATATGATGAAATTAATAATAPGPASAPPCAADLLLAELSDPGIKSFARAISRPGATHQHAFWLPDWFGPLASLREVAVRGRQRPASGLPPCLLWLHAGRTAPQLTSLTLTRLGLATLPEQLQHLTALTRLVAQDCSLSLMPRGIATGLSRLQHLDLSLNGLTSLPADFTAMTALQHLDLQRNKLAALPADLGRLTALTCLLLCNNQLRQLPPSLSALAAVQHLAASYNWLGGMSASLPLLCALPRLRRLELACVSDVRCRLVPPQELRLLAPQLTHLDLAANNLVPADVLGTLTCLRTLVLSDCGLLAVPPWVRRLAPSLAHLDLSTNSLSELPPWLPACGRLRYLSIAHNRLSLRVPPSVLEQMPQLRVVESE
ncbi:hypothetical protein HYH02_013333 [Chlamydomonas schloesseri]|uniref:Disease resistance R13L4/SHOC-2-like LRR domain-containing protein n=1 Tax=Chlamydomonas schloesseri TaxID=2026947 RepID=A0A835SWR5_9CHLO|nr:hypothetical protein HYH02_013333 [Chlamydomonas schloesseri]|eukprot:KAG2431343.1 hypothetical protein HYH02_013333 [Chlamydomonas schloesseri]